MFRLLRRLPGTNIDATIDIQVLSSWTNQARRLCEQYGRATVGDSYIGQLLARAPSEEDGSWPCRSMCEVLESVASEEVARGFKIGVYNARGVVTRKLNEGGNQERELSAKYRVWTQRLAFDYPYVANIMESIAEHYDEEAEREDFRARVVTRLEH